MKLFIEILKIIGLSVVTGLIILYLTKNNHISCSALDAFSNEASIALFFDFLKTMLIAFVIWVVGLIIYFVLRKKKKINLLLYFSLLTTISLYSFMVKTVTRQPEENRQLKQEICEKATDDGMMLNFLNLNKAEYDFINSKTKWLPIIPELSESVDINYWRDDFFGEYSLKIELTIPIGQTLDSISYPKWTFNGKKYIFEEKTTP
jgi:hypothetical protein